MKNQLLSLTELHSTTPVERAAMTPDDANYYIGLIVDSEFPARRNFETEQEQDDYKSAAEARFQQMVQSWPVIK